MNRMKKWMAWIGVWVLIACTPLYVSAKELELYSTAAVLMDGESGRILYEKDGQKPLANASTTKVLTCILILEQCDLNEELTISAYAASQPKVRLGVIPGKTYLVRDLLYSLMLESHNDSAVALAEHVGKREIPALSEKDEKDFTGEESRLAVAAFAKLMNEKAALIGCDDSWFITPNGLDQTESVTMPDGSERLMEHHTTAADLARIMAYAILRSPQREVFLQITRTPEYQFTAGGQWHCLQNHNSFLSMMDGALSGKTGFTGKAGYCYVGALKREDRYFIVSLLGCGWPNNRGYKWKDTRELMEYGLEHFRRVDLRSEEILFPEERLPKLKVQNGCTKVLEEEAFLTLKVQGRSEPQDCDKGMKSAQHESDEGMESGQYEGDEGMESGQPENDVTAILLRDGECIESVVRISGKVTAPVEAGQILGEIQYLLEGNVIRTEALVTEKRIPARDYPWCVSQVLRHFFLGTALNIA